MQNIFWENQVFQCQDRCWWNDIASLNTSKIITFPYPTDFPSLPSEGQLVFEYFKNGTASASQTSQTNMSSPRELGSQAIPPLGGSDVCWSQDVSYIPTEGTLPPSLKEGVHWNKQTNIYFTVSGSNVFNWTGWQCICSCGWGCVILPHSGYSHIFLICWDYFPLWILLK